MKALLEELKSATTYERRSEIYGEIRRELKKLGLGSGFFDAASAATNALGWDELIGGFGGNAQKFLDDLSIELSTINAGFAKELLETGKLAKEDGKGFFSDPKSIDKELVRREQAYAERKLSSQSDRTEIVKVINEGMNGLVARKGGGMFFDSADAINKVREAKRKTDPKAEFDYGDIRDRIRVGDMLAEKYRIDFLPNAIYCK
jgi:hypothetical protein